MATAHYTISNVMGMASGPVNQRMHEQLEKHNGDTQIGLPIEWVSLLMEELGEAAEAANHNNWSGSGGITPEELARFQDELLDIAALAVWGVAWCLNGGRSNVERPNNTAIVEVQR